MTALAATRQPIASEGLRTRDEALAHVADKVLSGGRLDLNDGMVLYETRDLPGLMRLADVVRRQKVGDKAYFVHSLRLSQTNICYVGCTFCGFQRRFGEEGVWDYDLPQVWEYVDQFWHPELTEIHISSGHHPKRQWDYYLDLVRGLLGQLGVAQQGACLVDLTLEPSVLTVDPDHLFELGMSLGRFAVALRVGQQLRVRQAALQRVQLLA